MDFVILAHTLVSGKSPLRNGD